MGTNRKLICAALAAAALLALLGGAICLSPSVRLSAYLASVRIWRAYGPAQQIKLGKLLPPQLLRMIEPSAPLRVQVEPGVSLLLDPEDLVSRTILQTGRWEPDSWQAVEQHLPPGGTFIDVGAHIGYYSLKAAKLVGKFGKVIAVEPNPETVTKLKDNIAASSVGIISVVPVACSDSESELELFVPSRRNTGHASLSRDNAPLSEGEAAIYRVRARPLDAILEDAAVSRVDVIKIDVEGAELAVLRGAKQTLTRHRPVLIIEVIDDHLRAMKHSAGELESFLKALGYLPQRRIGMNVLYAK